MWWRYRASVGHEPHQSVREKKCRLELVNDFVLKDVFKTLVGTGERKHDAVSKRIRDTLDAFADIGQIILLKIRVRRIQDDGLSFTVLMVEQTG